MTHRTLLALFLACLASVVAASLVFAHAALVESDPADGATITTLPYTLTVTFNEEIDREASTLFVENAAGEQVATGVVDPDDPIRMSAHLAALPDGLYTARWTAVTPNDGAVERGSFGFSITAANASPVATPLPQMPDTIPKDGSDLMIALVLAAVAIAAVVGFVFLRGRR